MLATIEEAFIELGIAEADRRKVVEETPHLREALTMVTKRFHDDLARSSSRRHLAGIDSGCLEARQVDHWTRLFVEGIGEDYVHRVTRIGLAHRERRILPDAHVRAYGRFAGELVGELMRRSTRSAHEFAEIAAAVVKLVHFDMAMALRAYEAALLD